MRRKLQGSEMGYTAIRGHRGGSINQKLHVHGFQK